MISNTFILIASVLVILMNLGFFSTNNINLLGSGGGYDMSNMYYYISRNLATLMLMGVMIYIVMF